MSYQVLARKYRPATFRELEGQEHVLQALVNALDNERLHHAYLFTGTRGVGKTTIARILARCLNCETGVTSEPCGTCSTCQEISEGRNVDLIEVDAASRTGVDDMRELLDNVQYMPTTSRFKIYLIDEVHMLSRSSFNAMLKTLEEPPEHVKFLFATTDPKKLPITILSRCLQFNLKNLSPEQIVQYLSKVLGEESLAFDESALWQLGHAADGSMRDALSLTDQAISFSAGEVRDEPVSAMLGSTDQKVVFELLAAISTADGQGLFGTINRLSEFAPDYSVLLDDILSVLHRVAIAHAVPEAVDNSQGDKAMIQAAARQIGAEEVQLLYQIGLIGQRDLPLAPMPRTGFEMVMLRMMSFVPGSVDSGEVSEPAAKPNVETPGATTANSSPMGELLSAINAEKKTEHVVAEPVPDIPEPEAERVPQPDPEPEPEVAQQDEAAPVVPLEPGNWSELLETLDLGGVTKTLAANCLLQSVEGDRCLLKLAEHHASLWNISHEERIAQGLSNIYGRKISVAIEVGETETETPAQRDERQRRERHAEAVEGIRNDQHVQQLVESFNARIDTDSISPLQAGEQQ